MRCRSSEKPKLKHRKGLWSPDEDQKLRDYVMNHGHGCWSAVPINAGLQRNGKSCRLRWINYLRPGLKKGVFTIQEEETILTLHGMLGNKWSQMSLHLPGRTDNEIKNYWHSYLKKKVSKAANLEAQTKSAAYTNSSMGSTETCMPPTRNMSVDSLDFVDDSSSEAGRFITPSFDHPKGAPQSNLPKVLFADWLSLEQFQGQAYSGSSDQNLVFGDDSCHGSKNTRTYIQNALLSNGGSINNNDNGFAGNFYHTQVKSDPIFNFICGGNYHYDDFSIDNFMYI